MKDSMPLWECVKRHAASGRLRLHVPAHRGGSGLPESIAEAFAGVARHDLTELPGLDDLHNPGGAIARAQRLAARLWQVDNCFFLVNGATSGILAMILAACAPGDVILVARNAHASVYYGLALSGAVPRYIPVQSTEEGFPLNVTLQAVKEALARYPGAKALVLTSPTYYGVCSDLEKISAAAQEAGVPLLLDEAHGAHFLFHGELPPAGTRFADLSVLSWHKSLGALTPGAVLLHKGGKINLFRLKGALKAVQSSSPSYPVMCSLDAVRAQMSDRGREMMAESLAAAKFLRGILRASGWALLERETLQEQGFDLDPTRLTVLTGRHGKNGIVAAGELSERGVDVELAGPDHFLAIVGPGFRKREAAKAASAFAALGREKKTGKPGVIAPCPVPEQVLTPREAFFREPEAVPLPEAAGRIAAEIVGAFPPGIPLLVPGERISGEALDHIVRSLKLGVQVRGVDAAGQIMVCREVG